MPEQEEKSGFAGVRAAADERLSQIVREEKAVRQTDPELRRLFRWAFLIACLVFVGAGAYVATQGLAWFALGFGGGAGLFFDGFTDTFG